MANLLVFISEQWLLVSLFLALVYLFAVTEHFKAGKQLSVHDVTRLLNAGEALLVDIRDAKEYQSGHINLAINIPFSQLNTRLDELESSRERIVIVVDKLGQQAASAGRTLRRAGFKVQRLRGGMAEWQGQSLPVVS